MTIMMTSHADLECASELTIAPAGGTVDPMAAVEQLPEVSVPVNSLVPGFHLRLTGTDATHVRLLADAAGSVKLPPILVQKRGARIIDGMHRVEVAKLRGEWTINARVVDCTDEEALVLAVKSNTLHGLPLTRADRISSAKRILTSHRDWSDRKVAMITGLSAKSITSLRNSSVVDAQFSGKRLGRDGKRRPMVAAEGRRRAAAYISEHPEASLREIARATDVSLGTVHDVRDKIRRGIYPDSAPPQQRAEDGSASPASPLTVSAHPESVRTMSACPEPARTGPEAVPDLPRPATSLHGRAMLEYGQRLGWSAMSAKLTADPALRYTDGGRAFLRWMAQHAMHADEWREFADAVPQRWLKDVWQLAAAMSDEWREFAEQLRYKQGAAS